LQHSDALLFADKGYFSPTVDNWLQTLFQKINNTTELIAIG